MRQYLKIACSTSLIFDLKDEDLAVVPISEDLNPSYLSAVVLASEDKQGQAIYRDLRDKLGLDLPLIFYRSGEEFLAELKKKITAYEAKVIPPFLQNLTDFADQKNYIFSTPGHHNGQIFDNHPAGAYLKQFYGQNLFQSDVSDSVYELGDMMGHEGDPLLAEKEAARAYHADKVYFVTNGTTGSNTICANAILSAGDLCLFDRNNHKSLYNSALVMTGARPVYLKTDRNTHGLIGPLTQDAFDEQKIRAEIAKVDPEKAKMKRPIRLAVLQLETYDGVFYNAKHIIKTIGQLCDYILFDCAWGGYEQFIKALSGNSPFQLELGPNDPGILVTESIHKQQAGFAQASQILKKDRHIKGQERYVDHKHFNHTYLQYVTTSYSYPIYASLVVNSAMVNSPKNNNYWQKAVELSLGFRKKLLKKSKLFKPFIKPEFNGEKWEAYPSGTLANNPKFWILDPKEKWHGFRKLDIDESSLSPLKLTIISGGVDEYSQTYLSEGIPGIVVEEYLHEHGIIPEKSDIYSTLYLITPGENEEDMNALLNCLLDFERAYFENQTIEQAFPRVYNANKLRYHNYRIQDLCSDINDFYQKNHIFKLMRDLFIKPNFQDYAMTPAQAEFAFKKNKSQLVKLDDVVGKIALEGALAYPPGVFIVAPGEKWQKIDVDYFSVLLNASKKFPGFEPEVQGVYERDIDGKTDYYCEVFKN